MRPTLTPILDYLNAVAGTPEISGFSDIKSLYSPDGKGVYSGGGVKGNKKPPKQWHTDNKKSHNPSI